MSESLLVVDGLAKTFRAGGAGMLKALRGVTFEMAAGEVVGLVGSSGAGKSTIARMIGGIEAPDAGSIRFEGVDLVRLRGRRRRALGSRLSLIFQDPYASLAPSMRVAQIVGEPLVIHRIASGEALRERVLKALAEVELTPPERYAARLPHELSGGQRQRVALARALVLRPALIVADEPTGMLDAALRRALIELIDGLRTTHGMAVLLITHDLALTTGFCDRLLVLAAGEVVEQGPTDHLLTAPRHPATTALVHAARELQPLAWQSVGDG